VLEGLVLESFTRMNQRRPPQSTSNPSELAVFRKAAIQTASMMFSILRRKVARGHHPPWQIFHEEFVETVLNATSHHSRLPLTRA
jgi:hypothetical protein